jgi:hypothetical protein
MSYDLPTRCFGEPSRPAALKRRADTRSVYGSNGTVVGDAALSNDDGSARRVPTGWCGAGSERRAASESQRKQSKGEAAARARGTREQKRAPREQKVAEAKAAIRLMLAMHPVEHVMLGEPVMHHAFPVVLAPIASRFENRQRDKHQQADAKTHQAGN